MLNRITIAGRLTGDPESRIAGEHPVTNIRIACTRNYRNAQDELAADFFNVTAWRKTAELLSAHWQKGDPIIVDGRLATRQYTDKTGANRTVTYIEAETVYFCGGKKATKERPADNAFIPEPEAPQAPPAIDAFSDFDLI